MYHRAANPPHDPWGLCVRPEHFNQQLAALKQHTDVIRIEQLEDVLRNGGPTIRASVVTFDDGYADNLYTAMPVLATHGLPATFFVASGGLSTNREFWWDELERIFLTPEARPDQLETSIGGTKYTWKLPCGGPSDRAAPQNPSSWRAGTDFPTARHRAYYELWQLLRPLSRHERDDVLEGLFEWCGLARSARLSHRLMTHEEVRRLAVQPRVAIGAHTVSHPSLPALPASDQDEELRSSRAVLEDLAGRSVHYFSYPYGDASQETVSRVRQAGFLAAFTTRERLLRPGENPLLYPRWKVDDWDGKEFASRLNRMLRYEQEHSRSR